MSSIRVFLTRPQTRNGTVPERLRSLGMAVVELPALAVRPLPPPRVLPTPEQYDLVVFVSRYAVQRYAKLLSAVTSGSPRWPVSTLAATVGASSARALHETGFIPSGCIVHPPEDDPSQDSEALFEVLLTHTRPFRRVLIARGAQGRPWLAAALREHGAEVDFLPVYERFPAQWTLELMAQVQMGLADPERAVFLITSGEGVHALAHRLSGMGLLRPWARASFVVIHERIAATLQSVLDRESGLAARHIELCRPDDDAIVETIHAVAKRTTEP